MKLGIVGHAAEKFTLKTEELARQEIAQAVKHFNPDAIVSGHSPMGGVDFWAEEVALAFHVPMIVHAPKINQWNGGFKERNLLIAKDSDLVLVVVVAELPPGFKGMKFNGCYHCKGRNPPHVKSGGCWTAWKAKAQEWRIIRDPDSLSSTHEP